MRVILPTVVLMLGCGDGEPKLDKLPNTSANVAANIERAKARVELIKKDLKAIAAKAVERMRRAASENFGPKAAAAAVITADEKDVKILRDEVWQVTGRYDGHDETGKRFTAPFTVNLQIMFYSLSADSVEMDVRTYLR